MRLKHPLLLLLFPATLHAQLPKDIASAIDNIEPKCIQWRHHLHQYPELSNREVKTARYVADHLKSLGMEVQENIAHTGVVGILKGKEAGPCIALRADMDALPILERNNLPYASKEKGDYGGEEVGVMHACGHDTHVAILMSVAEIMAGQKDKIKGTIKFIFQPAEEGPPAGEEGGAPLMIKEGVMDNPKVDAIFGLHISSNTPVGTLQYKAGAFMASSDWFSITVNGKGSHGSQPWLGVDPIAISAQIIQGLQHIVSRYSNLAKAPVVITVGKIESGVRSNIIPETAIMNGTIRTLDSRMQQQVHAQIRQVAKNIAEAGGATVDITIETKTLVTENDPALLQKILPALQKTLGTENVQEREWMTGAEDFSYFGTKAPAVFFFLGGMPPGQDPAKAPPHHTPDFVVDDAGMKTGIRALCTIITDYLKIK